MRPSQRLARSAIDATRFTPNSPHAYCRSSAILHSTASHAEAPSSSFPSTVPRRPSKSPSLQSPPPPPSSSPRETPAQKVARLRAEHIRNRQPKLTLWEKTVVRGRVVADKAHFVTAVFLIGLTVVAGVVTVFSLSDMILYNRRKRRAFFAEQNALLQAKLVEAKEVLACNGELTDEQRLILNREQMALEAERARREKKGVWDVVKNTFSSSGLKVEEGGDVRVGGAGEGLAAGTTGVGDEVVVVVVVPQEQPGSVLKAVEESRRVGERELESKGVGGGPLDQLANSVAADASQAVGAAESRSWFGWLSGR